MQHLFLCEFFSQSPNSSFFAKKIRRKTEEIADLERNPMDNYTEDLSFLQEQLKIVQQAPETIDENLYSEEYFL